MGIRRYSIKLIRALTLIFVLPTIVFLLPFNIIIFTKLKNFLRKVKNETENCDFFDLHTELRAGEVEYAANSIYLKGFPTKNGFIGELLKLNSEKKINLSLIGNSLRIKVKNMDNLPNFLKEDTGEKMFATWKTETENNLRNKSHVLRGDYVLKATLWGIWGFNFFFFFLLLIILGFSLILFSPIILYLSLFFGIDNSILGGGLIILIFSNLLFFIFYFLTIGKNSNFQNEGGKYMIKEYKKSIILNVIFLLLLQQDN